MLNFLKKLFTPKNISTYHTLKIKVAGVTFKNGRKSRQAILRKIKYQDEPFNGYLDVTFEGYDFEGEQAIGVYVNGQQIGNVPRTLIAEFLQYKDYPNSIESLNIYGGYDGKSFGCEITMKFKIS